MERVSFVEHRGARILLLDYSNLGTGEAMPVVQESMRLIAGHPPKSLLTLTDVSGTRYNSDVAKAFQELARHNEPFVARAALVGVDGLKQVVLTAIRMVTGREFNLFDTREQALDFLAGAAPAGPDPGA